MINKINNVNTTHSNPSFGSFSATARKYINPESIELLVKKGKVPLKDVDYLQKHKLEIIVTTAASTKGEGLFINYNHYKKPLTPVNDSFWGEGSFKDIHETLDKALKKAIEIAKKFDKVEEKKTNYTLKNAQKTFALNKAKTDCLNIINEETPKILDGTSTLEPAKMDELVANLREATKSLESYQKQEKKFDKKLKRIFTGWLS